MAGEVNFILKLVDRISAPAKVAASSLKNVEAQLRSVIDLAKQVPKVSLKVAARVPTAARATDRGGQQSAARLAAQQTKAVERAEKVKAQAALREQRQLQRAAESLDKQRSAALYKQFQARERAEVKAARDAAKAAQAAARPMRELGASAGSIGGMAPRAVAGLAAIGVAAAATAAAVAGLAVGLGALVFGGAKLAIEAAEAKADTLDMLEAMLGSQEAAAGAYTDIIAITKTVAVSQAAAQTLAQELTAAGVTNRATLVESVKAIAQTESVLKGSGAKIQGIVEKAAQTGKFEINAKKLTGTGVQLPVLYAELAKRTGKGVKEVEAQLKAGKIGAEVGVSALNAVLDQKFGAVAAKQAMDIGAQFQRFKDNITRLFEDVNTTPFLEALDKILSLFDAATPAGAAMKEVVTSAFNGIFAAAARVAPYVTTFFKGLVIIALQVAIAFKPLIRQLGLAFGGDARSGPLKLAEIMSLVGVGVGKLVGWFVKIATYSYVWDTIGAAITTMKYAIYAVGAALAVLAVGAAAVLAPFYAVIAAIVTIVAWLPKMGTAAWEAGKALVGGLVNGIKNAAGWLYDTVKNLALGALNKFKSFFGIQSPSKVMAKMGGHLTAGLSQGIHRGARAPGGAMVGAGAKLSLGSVSQLAPHLDQAMRAARPANQNYMGPAPAPPPRLAEPSRRTGSGGGITIQAGAFAPGAFQISGVKDADDLEARLPDMFADVMERAALQTGTD